MTFSPMYVMYFGHIVAPPLSLDIPSLPIDPFCFQFFFFII